MKNQRKAELQRKLATGSVPTPPPGLADRIKADIPKHLAPQGEPERPSWRSSALRVAASLILLVTTGIVTWRVMQPDVREPAATRARRPEVVPAINRTLTRPADEKVEPEPIAAEASAQTEKPVEAPRSVPSQRRAETRVPAAAEVQASAASADLASAGSTASEAATFIATEEIAPTEPFTQTARMADAAGAAPAAPAASPLPAPPPPSVVPVTETAQEKAATLTTTREAARSQAALTATQMSVATDPAAVPFERARTAIDSGRTPEDVDVAGIVNYFARAGTRSEYLVSTELSPAPTAADVVLLRVSVDTKSNARPLRGDTPRVVFDPASVLESRAIGGEGAFRPDASEHSMTIVYELRLRPELKDDARIATVNFREKSQEIRAGQLVATWSNASRRHRVSTIAAAWAESLQGAGNRSEIARAARELAAEDPRDIRTKELAAAAEAWARRTP